MTPSKFVCLQSAIFELGMERRASNLTSSSRQKAKLFGRLAVGPDRVKQTAMKRQSAALRSVSGYPMHNPGVAREMGRPQG
jgi:hypothetical protein